MKKRATWTVVVVLIPGFILGTLGHIAFPVGHNVSIFWPAAAIQCLSGIWFGGWGVIASTTFPIFSNWVTGGSTAQILGYIPSNLVQSLLPAVFYRAFPVLFVYKENKLHCLLWFGLFGAVIPHALGASLGISISYIIGDIKTIQVALWLIKWWIFSNTVTTVLFGFPLFVIMTPTLKEYGLIYRKYLS